MPPSDLVEVKLQVPGVGSNPFPLMVPVPRTSRKVELWDVTMEEVRSKVKPPTCHNIGVAGPGSGAPGVPELKVQFGAIVTLAKSGMLLKSPVCDPGTTKELFHVVTLVAVANDIVSKVTTPLKSILPEIVFCPNAAYVEQIKSANSKTARTRRQNTAG